MKVNQTISTHILKAIRINRGIVNLSSFSALIIFTYAFVYPPFLIFAFIPPVYRIVVELLVLVCLLSYSLIKEFKIPVNLLYVTILVVLLLLFNKDAPRNTLSFFEII